MGQRKLTVMMELFDAINQIFDKLAYKGKTNPLVIHSHFVVFITCWSFNEMWFHHNIAFNIYLIEGILKGKDFLSLGTGASITGQIIYWKVGNIKDLPIKKVFVAGSSVKLSLFEENAWLNLKK